MYSTKSIYLNLKSLWGGVLIYQPSLSSEGYLSRICKKPLWNLILSTVDSPLTSITTVFNSRILLAKIETSELFLLDDNILSPNPP